MDLDVPAFQGAGWSLRRSSSRSEAQAGLTWNRFGVRDQYSPLRSVGLCLPHPDWPPPPDWITIQYLARVDFAALRLELQRYAEHLLAHDVQVELLDLPNTLPDGRISYNAVFARDLLTVTPEGALCARMASTVRAGEELVAHELLAAARVPTLFSVHGRARFEGADLIWLDRGNVLLGVGERTSRTGAQQLRSVLGLQGVTVHAVRVPRGVQHLLGLVQIVSRERAFVRSALASRGLIALLRRFGHQVTDVPETDEVVEEHALNLTVLRPNLVLMHASAPRTRKLVERAGVRVANVVSAPNLLRAGGGIACATAILARAESPLESPQRCSRGQ